MNKGALQLSLFLKHFYRIGILVYYDQKSDLYISTKHTMSEVHECVLQGGMQPPMYMHNGYMMTYYPPIPPGNMPMYGMEKGAPGTVI